MGTHLHLSCRPGVGELHLQDLRTTAVAVTILLLSSRVGGAGLVELRAERAGAGRMRKRKRLRYCSDDKDGVN